MIRTKIIKNIILVLSSIFFTFLVLEVFIRFILKDGPRNALAFDLQDQPISSIEDTVLGWRPKTGKYTLKPWSKSGKATILTNLEDGGRLTGYNNKKEKIIFLGGSFTKGWAVDDNKTFSWLLQKKIKNYKIKNYGVSGYGGVQSFLKLQNIFENQNNIKLVIYGFIPHHEVRNIASGSWMYWLNTASRGTEGKLSLPYASIKDKKLKIHKPKQYLKLPFGNKSALITKIEKRVLKLNAFRRTLHETKISQEIILSMKKISEENKSRFAFLILQKIPGEKFIKYKEFFKKNSVDHINCYFQEGKEYIVEGEGHPNEIGHKSVSECIYDQLSFKDIVG
jgi:hypothetical protein